MICGIDYILRHIVVKKIATTLRRYRLEHFLLQEELLPIMLKPATNRARHPATPKEIFYVMPF